MTDTHQNRAAPGNMGLRRRSLDPERLPAFPPVSTEPRTESDEPAGGRDGRQVRRRGLPLGIMTSVVIAAAGAGVVVTLDPFSGPSQQPGVVAAKLQVPAVPTVTESAPPVAHTGALQVAEVPAPRKEENAAIVLQRPVAQPPERHEVEVPKPAQQPVVVASIDPLAPPLPSEVKEPSQPRAAAVPMTVSPAEIDNLIAKGENLLKAGDLASARLFFGRAAQAGDPRAARGMAHTYDPAVVRKLPVYGLPADQAQADTWYQRARELVAGKAVAER